MIIKCTDGVRPTGVRGQGQFHPRVIEDVLGIDVNDDDENDVFCCGGFAYHGGELKFNSILNRTDQEGCESDGRRELSRREKILVEYCWKQYERHGKNHVFRIPSIIDEQLDD